MKKYSQWTIFGIAFTMLLILTTACSLTGGQAATPTPTPTPKPKAPLTVLKESQKKMDALQSLALNGTYASKTSSTDSGDTDTQMKLSGQMSKSPTNSVSLRIDGTVITHGTPIPLSLGMIAINQQGYVQNSNRPASWYILNDQQGKDLLGGGIGSIGTTKSNLLDVVTDSDITDHGTETVNGKNLRHLTITVTDTNKALKKAFLESTGDFKDLTPEQLDSIKLQTGTMDYWIDETTMYTYQQSEHYIAQYHVDANNAVTSGTPNLTKDQTMTLMYSSFNVPVSIKAPENAQPLQSFLDLF